MALILLIRHGVTDLTGVRLYGRAPGVHLSEEGRRQAARLAERLAPTRLAALYTSPLDRCLETARPIAAASGVTAEPLDDLVEIDYGRLAGRTFRSLAATRTWRRIHGSSPASVRFPGGETLAEAQRRAVEALDEIASRHRRRTVGVVTHGDLVALALAHYAGIHVDLFMRIEVAPGSVSAVSITDGAPKIRRVNDTGTLEDLAAPARRRSTASSGPPRSRRAVRG